MKLLPKQSIDKEKAYEHKQEIDYGVNLASKIDALRQTKLEEEKNLFEWRKEATESVQSDIDKLLEEKSRVLDLVESAKATRLELIAPLNNEWQELRASQEAFNSEKEEFSHNMEVIRQAESDFEHQLKEVASFTRELKQREIDVTEKESSINPLHALAEKRLDEIRESELQHASEYQDAKKELSQLREQYENGVKINEITERTLNERENELIIRENRLATRQKAFGIAEQEINKNGTGKPNNSKR